MSALSYSLQMVRDAGVIPEKTDLKSELTFIQDFAPLPGQYDKQLLGKKKKKKKTFYLVWNLFLGLLPHMLKTDLAVLMYRKMLEDLVFKDYEKPL